MAVELEEYARRTAAAGRGTQGSFGGSGASSSSEAPRRVYLGPYSEPTREEVTTRKRVRQPPNAMVIDGDRSIQRYKTSTTSRPGLVTYDNMPDIDSTRTKVFEWYGTPAFDRWGDYLFGLGLIDETEKRDITVLDEWWQDALELSARFVDGGKRVTPHDAIRLLSETGGGSGAAGRGGSTARQRGFTGTRTHTAREVDLTDPKTAQALVNDVLTNALGRAALPEEITAFRNSLAAYEQSNPTVRTTTSQYDDGVETSQSSTVTGGVTAPGRAEVMREQAMELPEYGAYQAASTYMNAFFNAIQSPV